jgi:hypothetical protein
MLIFTFMIFFTMILDGANGETRPLEKYLILLLFLIPKSWGNFFFGEISVFFSVNLTNFVNYLDNPENIY